MSKGRAPVAHRLREERGQALIFFAVAVVAVFGIAGFAIDTANMLQLRRELQASTDAAALAAAQFLPDASAARAAANSYSSLVNGGGSGVDGKNRRANHHPVTMETGYPLTKCVTKPGYPPCTSPQANVIVVRQTSDMPTFFSRVIGRNVLKITAHSAALMKGGVPETLDVAIIIDTTQSMNSSAACAGLGNVPRLTCAMAGARALLNGFWPCPDNVTNCGMAQAVDAVSLWTFPGLSNAAQQAFEYDCSNSPQPSIATYSASTLYKILSLTNDYKTSNTSALNTNSNLVKAARGGTTSPNCTQGIHAVGGVGTYYAGAITAAQADLVANGRSSAQNVIILLSDGDAQSGDISSSLRNNQCTQAVNAAAAARTAGTWVYSIAYGAPTGSSSCDTDSSSVTACNTMRQIASDSSKFYSTVQSGGSACTSAANPQTDLIPIFQHIALSLTTTRLVDE